MSSPQNSADKLEHIRKRSKDEKNDKDYAARLETIEEQRAAKARKRVITLAVIALVFAAFVAGTVYFIADLASSDKANPDLISK